MHSSRLQMRLSVAPARPSAGMRLCIVSEPAASVIGHWEGVKGRDGRSTKTLVNKRGPECDALGPSFPSLVGAENRDLLRNYLSSQVC